MELFYDIRLFFVFMLTVSGAAACCAVFTYHAVRIIKRQIKLYHSITLVELKTRKWHYWLFAALLIAAAFYIITRIAAYGSYEYALLRNIFNAPLWAVSCMLCAVFAALLVLSAFLTVLALSRNAVVDKGVYTNFGHLDWYHVHDYIIDEKRLTVILSSSEHTFFTLAGTTPPFRVAKNDVLKLKFILNKNKNKFSGFNKEELVSRDGR